MDDAFAFNDAQSVRIARMSPVPEPAADTTNAVADDPDAAHFGQWLYFDTRFSGNGEVACATCHDPEQGFADGVALGEGLGPLGRHTPSVLNTAANRWFFWDGRKDTQWSQALGPMESRVEHGGNRLQFAHLIDDDIDLRAAYEAVFGALPSMGDPDRFPDHGMPDPGDPDGEWNLAWESMEPDDQDLVNRVFTNMGKAIAAYERLLMSGKAPIDDFVDLYVANDEGWRDILTDKELVGLDLFVGRARCHLCHLGPSMTNLEFHNLGLPQRNGVDGFDGGRFDGVAGVRGDPFNGAGSYSDDPVVGAAKLDLIAEPGGDLLGAFKVPSLRDVALHPPYMHGGHFADLTEVVEFYNELADDPLIGHREELLQPLELSEDEVASVVALLEGAFASEEFNSALLRMPDSPQR